MELALSVHSSWSGGFQSGGGMLASQGLISAERCNRIGFSSEKAVLMELCFFPRKVSLLIAKLCVIIKKTPRHRKKPNGIESFFAKYLP